MIAYGGETWTPDGHRWETLQFDDMEAANLVGDGAKFYIADMLNCWSGDIVALAPTPATSPDMAVGLRVKVRDPGGAIKNFLANHWGHVFGCVGSVEPRKTFGLSCWDCEQGLTIKREDIFADEVGGLPPLEKKGELENA